jgi:hypothetical protein
MHGPPVCLHAQAYEPVLVHVAECMHSLCIGCNLKTAEMLAEPAWQRRQAG